MHDRECEQNSSHMVELVPGISDTDPTAAGLLIECRARSDKALDVSPPSTCVPVVLLILQDPINVEVQAIVVLPSPFTISMSGS